ncbi:MAG: hypothetical protein ACRETZ_11280 [Steroidobacteraceae bacterium]
MVLLDEPIDFTRFRAFAGSGAHGLMPRLNGMSTRNGGAARMHALSEEFSVEDPVMQLEPRVARIEADVAQINARVANVEVDMRELRKSMDQKVDKLDARFDKTDDKIDARFDKVDARFDKVDARFDKVDARIDRLDTKFESKLEAFTTRRFTLWVAVLSSAATMAAAVLAVIFGSLHAH